MIEKRYHEFRSRCTANMMEMSTSASNVLVRQGLSSTLLKGGDTIYEPVAAPMQIKTATMFSKKIALSSFYTCYANMNMDISPSEHYSKS
jgi:hypothetical protein